jgi:ATP-dependent protease ClpP protease subunit
MKIVTQHQIHQALEMVQGNADEAQRRAQEATTPEEKAVWSLAYRILVSKRNPRKGGCCG